MCLSRLIKSQNKMRASRLQDRPETAPLNERLLIYILGGDRPGLGSALGSRGFGLLQPRGRSRGRKGGPLLEGLRVPETLARVSRSFMVLAALYRPLDVFSAIS
jgi:hypothetical protein